MPPPKYESETREGWPLLTVETEVNGDIGSTYERVPSLVGALGIVQQAFDTVQYYYICRGRVNSVCP